MRKNCFNWSFLKYSFFWIAWKTTSCELRNFFCDIWEFLRNCRDSIGCIFNSHFQFSATETQLLSHMRSTQKCTYIKQGPTNIYHSTAWQHRTPICKAPSNSLNWIITFTVLVYCESFWWTKTVAAVPSGSLSCPQPDAIRWVRPIQSSN